MPTVYRARDITDAAMIRDVLGQSGIDAHVRGGDLQSGMGELPAGGLVAVWVDDADAVAARDVVARWERGEFALADEDENIEAAPAPVPGRKASTLLAFAAGAAFGAFLVWLSTHGPTQSDELDENGDGRIDTRLIRSTFGLERSETDRNHDGRPDLIAHYARDGGVRTEADDDFDGRFETRERFSGDRWLDSESDRNGDGATDYRREANAGVIARELWFDPDGRVRKQVLYEDGRARVQELDRDGDGTFERRQRLDDLAEPDVTN